MLKRFCSLRDVFHGACRRLSGTGSVHKIYRREETASLDQWNTVFNCEPQLDALSEELLRRVSRRTDSGKATELDRWFQYYAPDAFATIAVGSSVQKYSQTNHIWSNYSIRPQAWQTIRPPQLCPAM